LEGTPTVDGTYTFTVTVNDSSNPMESASHEFTLVVDSDTDPENDWPFNLNVPAGYFIEYRSENDYEEKSVDLLKSAFTSPDNIYIPQTVGDIVTSGSQTINWDVKGDILLDANIAHDRNSDVKIISKEGSIIINTNIVCSGPPFNNHILDIKANKDINISENSIIQSQNGQQGIRIESEKGSINAKGVLIDSQRPISASVVKILAKDRIDISNADIKSNATNNPKIEIKSYNGEIIANNVNISSGSAGNNRVVISAREYVDASGVDTSIVATGILGLLIESTHSNVVLDNASIITNAGNNGTVLRIESSGSISIIMANIDSNGTSSEPIIFKNNSISSSDIFINNANISVPAGKLAKAYKLTPQGSLASGSITYD